jgi:hypothetical protein
LFAKLIKTVCSLTSFFDKTSFVISSFVKAFLEDFKISFITSATVPAE